MINLAARSVLGSLALASYPLSVATTPEWQFVERITIGSAVTTQDFTTVLDGNSDLGYRIVASIIAGSSTYPAYSLRVNGATIACNRRYIFASSTTVATAATDSSIFILGLQPTSGTAKEGGFSAILNYSRTGYERLWRFHGTKANAVVDWQEEFTGTLRMTTPNTSTNITSLGVHCNAANGIGVGSILTLYKKGG